MSDNLCFDKILPRLKRSKFRMRFDLANEDLSYIEKIGPDKLKQHAAHLIRERIAPAEPKNDGRQTPFKGHPVFKAQHATATCCRGCLEKWYSVPKGRVLSEEESGKIVGLILDWIRWRMS